MSAARGEFSSKLGFLMAAAGSAVGLGNIWGFPTKVAENGGAAFVLIYLVMAFCLAYPALMAELIIGRHAKANSVKALQSISGDGAVRHLGTATGLAGILTACLILGFYGIVAGWMVAHSLASLAELLGMSAAAEWLASQSIGRSLLFTAVFMGVTISIIVGGVSQGIEKWCTRLMPSLLMILLALIVYVMTLDGAMEGVRAYLVPDFSRATNPDLILDALGQAFFSLSLGVGTMLIYGSYISPSENLTSLGRSVTLLDVGIAFVAGFLIIPAMHVAQKAGVPIYDASGKLMADDGLVFAVLPALFATMGVVGAVVSFAFFIFLSLASLTSTISMLEVPVAYAVENHDLPRKRATLLAGAAISVLSIIIIFNFNALFGLVVSIATQYGQPLGGLMLCIFAGWVMHRNKVLEELKSGDDGVEGSMFWKIWPFYVRFICPTAIFIVFVRQTII